MTDRTWFSRKQGDPVPTIVMEVRGNTAYRQTFVNQPVNASNVDTGSPEDYTGWSEPAFRLTFSDTHGGTEISGATAVGGTGVMIADATAGKLLIRLSKTQTGALQTHLAGKGISSRGSVKALLYGQDAAGDQQAIFTAEVKVQFGTAASA